MSGDSRIKLGVGCIINKKYEGYISKWIGETERILSVEYLTPERVRRDKNYNKIIINKMKDHQVKIINVKHMSIPIPHITRQTKKLYRETNRNTVNYKVTY